MSRKKGLPDEASSVQTRASAAPETVADALFDRVVEILEQARTGVVRAVNTHTVMAYWLIGREIVLELQGGEKRAEYGRKLIAGLSERLTARYGEGFSVTGLQDFRKFYLTYSHRSSDIQRPLGVKSGHPIVVEADSFPTIGPAEGAEIGHAARDESLQAAPADRIPRPMGAESNSVPTVVPFSSAASLGFSPQLSWSHYRALMRVPKAPARDFYEREAILGGWDKRTLERQIHSFYYERLLKSQQPEKLLAEGRRLERSEPAIDTLKQPYILEFLDLPEIPALQESDLETGILSALQSFLMELGHGFAFVARQKRLTLESDNRFVDLVFYHIQLRFFLLIDLKIGKLTHGDVGQMDGYVRMFDELYSNEGDNPSIGLILCTEKDEVVARYSVLNDRKQIFASKYMLYLPTEEELRREIERERRLIEAALEPSRSSRKKKGGTLP